MNKHPNIATSPMLPAFTALNQWRRSSAKIKGAEKSDANPRTSETPDENGDLAEESLYTKKKFLLDQVKNEIDECEKMTKETQLSNLHNGLLLEAVRDSREMTQQLHQLSRILEHALQSSVDQKREELAEEKNDAKRDTENGSIHVVERLKLSVEASQNRLYESLRATEDEDLRPFLVSAIKRRVHLHSRLPDECSQTGDAAQIEAELPEVTAQNPSKAISDFRCHADLVCYHTQAVLNANGDALPEVKTLASHFLEKEQEALEQDWL